MAADCGALRTELRAFYPTYGQFSGPVKDPRQKESYERIEAELKGYVAAHPDYDALDLRRETYLLMRKHFVPFLFKNSPFYFRVCCQYGMHLLQPNCLSVEELEDAKIHPENHRDLIVKVCGFSARFVALSPKWQDEVINRHRLK